jgi:hypothetical protein
MSTIKADTLSNLAGTQTVPVSTVAQGSAKAWVNFDGTLASDNIRASFNVSSVARSATGIYVVNFTTAMPDVNYSVCGAADNSGTAGNPVLTYRTFATASITIYTQAASTGNNTNNPAVSVSIFR